MERNPKLNQFLNSTISFKAKFSKLFLKNQGKLYSCLIPQFFKRFSIATKNSQLKLSKLISSTKTERFNAEKMNRILLMRSSKLTLNKHKSNNVRNSDYQLTLLKLIEQPFKRSTKSIGLYSITEDYF